ncbi:7-deoxyloganetic acid glucosyltransferase-like [Lycium ferocissimum]|uniref:7-deoxyloganetic acid glucosyltransferase-like n=1 Tax=Lycium ferocissimum TaxID=112874 RepID=UPI002815BC18|nr:7-deoxyloganetic acid glucosyltransferase-like [Lycium ferocissimum]
MALIPHVLIFPLPLQGPVNCMLKLAELLCLHQEIHVTFLNTEHIQQRLLNCTDVQIRFEKYPNFKFVTIPDGLPEDNPRNGEQVGKLIEGVEEVSNPLLREMVACGSLGPNSEKPITCLIVDGIFTFAVDVAKEVGIPLLYFDTISPCGLWTYLAVPKLIEAGEIPFKGNDLDALINSLPGMEGIIRRRDLPSFCRTPDLNSPIIQHVIKEGKHIVQAQGLIFNTFEGLEGPILSQFQSHCPNIYAIGPLHIQMKAKISSKCLPNTTTSNSLWKDDMSCLDWLDTQPEKSVLFVSIGSLATMSMAQFLEFWYGLVNSKIRFLWVQRPGSIVGLEVEDNINVPIALSESTKERGCIVSWAPQEEVLAHPSIGGFLTHSGWNSTLESIVEGVPMICWPYFVDQQVNSRYVGEVWKLGLDMKDVCDRDTIERMVREVMEVRKIEFLERAKCMSSLAIASVSEGGSSYQDLDRLIEDIRLMRI